MRRPLRGRWHVDGGDRERAWEPEALAVLFLARAGDGDVGGVVALYEPGAVLATPDGVVTGHDAIRRFYEQLLEQMPVFKGDIRPALRTGDLALTSTCFATGATVEVARRQADGTWLWVIDQPNVLASRRPTAEA